MHLVGVNVTEQYNCSVILLTDIRFSGKEGTYKTDDKGMFCEIWVDPIPSILQVEPLAIWTGGCEVVASPDSILLLPVMWSVAPESTIHDDFDAIKQLEVIPGWAKVALGVCG